MNPQFASAGNAQEKSSTAPNPVGLYRHPDGHFIGVIDPIQGDAVVRQGFVLSIPGREAAMSSEKELTASFKSESTKKEA